MATPAEIASFVSEEEVSLDRLVFYWIVILMSLLYFIHSPEERLAAGSSGRSSAARWRRGPRTRELYFALILVDCHSARTHALFALAGKRGQQISAASGNGVVFEY